MHLLKFITTQPLALRDLLNGIKNYKKKISFFCNPESMKIIEEKDNILFYIILHNSDKPHKYYYCNSEFKITFNVIELYSILKNKSDSLEIYLQNGDMEMLFIKLINNGKQEEHKISIINEQYKLFKKDPVEFRNTFSINTFNFIEVLNNLKYLKKTIKKESSIYISIGSNYIKFSNDYDENYHLIDILSNIELDSELTIKLNFKKFYELIKYNHKLSLFVKVYIKKNAIILIYDGIFKITNMVNIH